MNLIYKKIPPEESLLYRAVRLESLKFHPNVFEANFFEEERKPELMLEASIKEESDSNFVIGAFSGAFLVGICGFVSRNRYALDSAGTIIQMYVKEEYRGGKIGLHLTNKVVEEVLKAPKINRIILEVKKNNNAAIAVYESAGFKSEDIKSEPELSIMALRIEG